MGMSIWVLVLKRSHHGHREGLSSCSSSPLSKCGNAPGRTRQASTTLSLQDAHLHGECLFHPRDTGVILASALKKSLLTPVWMTATPRPAVTHNLTTMIPSPRLTADLLKRDCDHQASLSGIQWPSPIDSHQSFLQRTQAPSMATTVAILYEKHKVN